jgi:hypothetical protein
MVPTTKKTDFSNLSDSSPQITEPINFKEIFQNCPNLIWRLEVPKIFGKLINGKTMANLDSLGKGPDGRIRIGRKIAYEKTKLIKWLESRATRLN